MRALRRTFNFINNHPLAKRRKLLAISKFIQWQIKSRVKDDLVVVPFLEHTKVFAKRGLTGITGNIYTGLHEFEDMAFLLHFLRAEDTFFDVGANVGSYSLLAAGECRARTLAFEPIPGTYSILHKNIELNGLSDILRAENKGVGSKKGILKFTKQEDTTNHILSDTESERDSITVQVVSLDEYYPAFTPALIKIDVEGFETEVLRGAENILNDHTLKAIVIELNGSGGRYGFNEEDIHSQLLGLSFKPYVYDAFGRSLSELSTFGRLNTIYIRDIHHVSKKLKEAPAFKIFHELI